MKRAAFLASVLVWWGAGIHSARAEVAVPSLTVKDEGGREMALELRDLSVAVRFVGGFAETVLEMEYFNRTKRRQEGEFVLQLPEGATVSTYALEIDGALRPAVSVEAEKARFAYESIKRRMVDPGLVEREAENRYRTRIFPIMPESPKRVRIGYVQWLGGGKDYRFPLSHEGRIGRFACEVTGAATAGLPIGGVKLIPGDPPETWRWSAEGISLDGVLTARSKALAAGGTAVFAERTPSGDTHFVVQGRMPEEWKSAGRRKPEHPRLIWDASGSGRNRDRAGEFAVLNGLWKWLGEARVTVRLLRDRLETPREFAVKNGAGKEIEEFLRSVGYDGVADYSRIDAFAGDGPTLLVSDGQPMPPGWAESAKDEGANPGELILIGSDGGGIDAVLANRIAMRLDPADKDWLAKWTGAEAAPRVEGLPAENWETTREGDSYVVSGHLPAGFAGAAPVRVGGAVVATLSPGAATPLKDEWGLARRIRAQRRLGILERIGEEAGIVAFAKAERLASDFTSLIVLERFEDHLRYRIPPPEPEWRARYESEVDRGDGMARSKLSLLWTEKKWWHQTQYPWLDWRLEEQVGTVSIWVKSAREAFPEETLNRDTVEPYEKWLPEARRIVAAKSGLANEAAFDQWRADVVKHIEALDAIRRRTKDPLAGQTVHVSVRGFVNQRGIVSGKSPMTLEEAIGEARGVLTPWGTLSRVYLYRDGSRTGYNLESQAYRPVPLRWGDMIVVEAMSRRPEYYGDFFAAPVDPFAAPAAMGSGGGAAAAPAFPFEAEDAVFERPGESAVPMPFAEGAIPGGPGSTPAPRMDARVVAGEAVPLGVGTDDAMLSRLRQQADPSKAYEELVATDFRKQSPSPATLIELARILSENGAEDLAARALSNLPESMSNPVEGVRAMALWLADFGLTERALDLLRRLEAALPDEATRAIVRHDIARISDKAEDFRGAVEAELAGGEVTALGPIALTDYFGRKGRADGALSALTASEMTSDVRIVVDYAGDDLLLQVSEPGATVDLVSGVSPHGGRIEDGPRAMEYQMRVGLPGDYRISCHRREKGTAEEDRQPVTVRVTYYLGWGGRRQSARHLTRLLDGDGLMLDAIRFGFAK